MTEKLWCTHHRRGRVALTTSLDSLSDHDYEINVADKDTIN